MAVLALGMVFFGCNQEPNGPDHSQNNGSELESEPRAELPTTEGIVDLGNGMLVMDGDMVLSRASLLPKSSALAKGTEVGALMQNCMDLVGLGSYCLSVAQWPAGSVIDYYFDQPSGTIAMSTRQKNDLRRALKDLSYGVNIAFREVSSASTHAVRVRAYSGENPDCPGAAACASLGKSSALPATFVYNGQTYTTDNARFNFAGFSQSNHGLNYEVFMHEFMHVLGFTHEMRRMDRNDYVTVADSTNSQYVKTAGNYLNTSFDKSSMMMYSGVQSKEDPTNTVWRWIGRLPLMSGVDANALVTKFGSEATTVSNVSYIKHIASGKYICRNNNAPQLQTTTGDLCKWEISRGVASVGYKYSATNVLILNSGTVIRTTEKTATTGFSIYLSYTQASNTFSLMSQGGDQYASKWIPFTYDNSGSTGTVLWNGNACLGLNSTNTALAAYECPESSFPANYVSTSVQWEFIPAWSPTVAY